MAPINFLTIFKFLAKDNIKIVGPLIVLLFGCQLLIDIKFSCPCITGWNQAVATLIFVVPAVLVFLIMLLFLLYKVQNITKTQTQDNTGTIQSEETELNCSSLCFCLVPSMVWLCIFFIDGDYIACGLTYRNGHYACENELHPNCLNWCKPTRFSPGTNETELYEQTRTFINGSKITGYILATGFCFLAIVMTLCSLKRHKQEFQNQVPKKNRGQQDPTNPTKNMELQEQTNPTENRAQQNQTDPKKKPRLQPEQNIDSYDMKDSEDPAEKDPLNKV